MLLFSAISLIVNLAVAIFWTRTVSAHPVSQFYQPSIYGTELTAKNISYSQPPAPQEPSPAPFLSYSFDLSAPSPVQAQNHSFTMTKQASINVQSPATSVFNTLRPDGTYAFGYKTPDGQSRNENTLPDGTTQGNYAYRTPDGNLVTINYSAGRHGFVTSSGPASHASNSVGSNRFVDSASSDRLSAFGQNNSFADFSSGNRYVTSGRSHPFSTFGIFNNFSSIGSSPFKNSEGSNQFVITQGNNHAAKSETSNPFSVYAINNSASSVPFTSGGSRSASVSHSVVTSVGSNSVASDVYPYASSGAGSPSQENSAFTASVGSRFATNNPGILSKGSNLADGNLVASSSEGSSSGSNVFVSSFSRHPAADYATATNSAIASKSKNIAVSSADGPVASASFDSRAGGVKQTASAATSGFPTSSPFWVYAHDVPQHVNYQSSYFPFGQWMSSESSTLPPPTEDISATYEDGSRVSKVPSPALSTNVIPFRYSYGSNPTAVHQPYLS